MSDIIERVKTETVEGFEINLYALVEHDDPAGHFASGDDTADKEICDKIESGDFVWFVAKVTASKNDIELASDYLGGCCYESYEQFANDDDYYSDMKTVVIEAAKKAIAGLVS